MKILIFSVAPWVQSGYGRICRDLMNGLGKHFDVDILTYYGLQGGDIQLGPHKVYKNIENGESLIDIVSAFRRSEADVILQHFDTWILSPHWIQQGRLPVVTYSPIDCVPAPIEQLETLSGAITNACMSRHVETMLKNEGYPTEYLPHHYDEKAFSPRDKATCRKVFGLPEDAFIFGSVGTNIGPRKNLIQQYMAFKMFLEKNPDAKDKALFYAHADIYRSSRNSKGYELGKYLQIMEEDPHCVFDLYDEGKLVARKNPFERKPEAKPTCNYTNRSNYYEGLSDGHMEALYNSFDVLMQVSRGEGFGLPIIEAGACGVPSIATKFSSMPDVMGSGGLLVQPADYDPQWIFTAWHAIPSTQGIVQAMERLYYDEAYLARLNKKAIKNALKYQKSLIMPRWVKLFKDLESEGVI